MPPPDELWVAIAELKAAGPLWHDKSAMMTSLSHDATGLKWSGGGGWLFSDFLKAYNEAIDSVTTLSRQAAKEMTAIGETLQDAANTYEAEERNGVHRLKNLW
ncbi:hypothetical protein [Gordonia crocea]|uniref:ESX-1 secretion-associated protein n=1 Tax=Gordonia crocea TaxID=589162 RepID=A0A7I9UXT4_9ACTN|nr:hypothetical protein [Gordonia crocea]GED98014.1 hypothetical protein nbrc107697_20530 [Gordonia crocea]